MGAARLGFLNKIVHFTENTVRARAKELNISLKPVNQPPYNRSQG
jgi:hypothetical protein